MPCSRYEAGAQGHPTNEASDERTAHARLNSLLPAAKVQISSALGARWEILRT